MGNYDGATIEIKNWDKYNPRKDLKATSWVRLQNTLFEDSNFFDFSHSELCFWIYLLSIASKKQTGTLRLSLAHAERIGRFSARDVESTLTKLIELECVTCTLRTQYETKTVENPTNERSNFNETNVTDETYVRAPGSSNPDAYPIEKLEPKGLDIEGPTATALTWRSYRDAYREKYGAPPPYNAKMGGQLKSFVSRVPKEEAPGIAAFYLTHKDQFYVKSMHPVGLLLRDAEKIRTEWATGRQMTGAQAKHSEQRSANVEAMKTYLAKKGLADG